MRTTIVTGALALLALAGGCKQTSDGRVVIQRPGEVNVSTKEDTISLPKVELPKVNVPKIEMPHIKVHEQVDTVNAPTVGTEKRVVKYPGLKVKQ